MAQLPFQQLRGVKDLLQGAVDAGVNASERLHLEIARKPYTVLKQLDPIAAPVQTVEQIQESITLGVYQSIRAITRISATVAGEVIDRIEAATPKK